MHQEIGTRMLRQGYYSYKSTIKREPFQFHAAFLGLCSSQRKKVLSEESGLSGETFVDWFSLSLTFSPSECSTNFENNLSK